MLNFYNKTTQARMFNIMLILLAGAQLAYGYPDKLSVTGAGRDEANGLYKFDGMYENAPRYKQELAVAGVAVKGSLGWRRPMYIWYYADRQAWYMGHWVGSWIGGSTYMCPVDPDTDDLSFGPPRAGARWEMGHHGRAFCQHFCLGRCAPHCPCTAKMTLRSMDEVRALFAAPNNQENHGLVRNQDEGLDNNGGLERVELEQQRLAPQDQQHEPPVTQLRILGHRRIGITMRETANGYEPVPMKFDSGLAGWHGYRTFQARLDALMVEDQFGGQLQEWNHAYPPAQKIFGNNPTGFLARQCIRQQNNVLYAQRPIKDFLTAAPRSCRNTTSGDEFLELINYGKLANNESTFFTYVLLQDGTWRFAHTGSSLWRDYLSKHAVLSNASPFVRYAGEFHVRDNANGSYTLVVDNNSGTFAPANSELPAMGNTLKLAFPGLDVETLEARIPNGSGGSMSNPALDDAIAACPSRAV